MGRAIVREPQVFLMDEPLSNLDAKLRVQMRSEIAQVQHDLNVTTIYVTHDQTEAMTMGDRVAVMKAGILEEVGDPQYLYDNPAKVFVAGVIGSPPMNMALGRVVREGDDVLVRPGSATLRLHPNVVALRPPTLASRPRSAWSRPSAPRSWCQGRRPPGLLRSFADGNGACALRNRSVNQHPRSRRCRPVLLRLVV